MRRGTPRSAGFTLTEVVIATGIFTFVALVMMQIMNTTMQSEAGLQNKFELQDQGSYALKVIETELRESGIVTIPPGSGTSPIAQYPFYIQGSASGGVITMNNGVSTGPTQFSNWFVQHRHSFIPQTSMTMNGITIAYTSSRDFFPNTNVGTTTTITSTPNQGSSTYGTPSTMAAGTVDPIGHPMGGLSTVTPIREMVYIKPQYINANSTASSAPNSAINPLRQPVLDLPTGTAFTLWNGWTFTPGSTTISTITAGSLAGSSLTGSLLWSMPLTGSAAMPEGSIGTTDQYSTQAMLNARSVPWAEFSFELENDPTVQSSVANPSVNQLVQKIYPFPGSSSIPTFLDGTTKHILARHVVKILFEDDDSFYPYNAGAILSINPNTGGAYSAPQGSNGSRAVRVTIWFLVPDRRFAQDTNVQLSATQGINASAVTKVIQTIVTMRNKMP
jgi:hypothetical protein